MTVAGGVRHLGRLIEDGDLDTLLTQPRSVLVYALGMRSQPSGVGDLISGLIFIATSGEVAWRTLPLLLAALLASAAVFVACGIVFFSLAFWLGNVETMARQLWELLITFSLYPEPLFGGVLRLALFTVLPAGFVGYLPVRVVHAPSFARGVPAGARRERVPRPCRARCSIAACAVTRPAAGSARSGKPHP